MLLSILLEHWFVGHSFGSFWRGSEKWCCWGRQYLQPNTSALTARKFTSTFRIGPGRGKFSCILKFYFRHHHQQPLDIHCRTRPCVLNTIGELPSTYGRRIDDHRIGFENSGGCWCDPLVSFYDFHRKRWSILKPDTPQPLGMYLLHYYFIIMILNRNSHHKKSFKMK